MRAPDVVVTEQIAIAVWGTTDSVTIARRRQHAPGSAAPWPALYLAFFEALRARGLLPPHAAVIVRGGRAIALMGSSGTGKTTADLPELDTLPV